MHELLSANAHICRVEDFVHRTRAPGRLHSTVASPPHHQSQTSRYRHVAHPAGRSPDPTPESTVQGRKETYKRWAARETRQTMLSLPTSATSTCMRPRCLGEMAFVTGQTQAGQATNFGVHPGRDTGSPWGLCALLLTEGRTTIPHMLSGSQSSQYSRGHATKQRTPLGWVIYLGYPDEVRRTDRADSKYGLCQLERCQQYYLIRNSDEGA